MDVVEKEKRREPQWKEKIMEYIRSKPAQERHYGRNGAPNKKYLPAELSLVKLYKGFLGKNVTNPLSHQYLGNGLMKYF